MSKKNIVIYYLIHLNFIRMSYPTFTFLLSLSIALLVITLLFSLDHNVITADTNDANAVKHHNNHHEDDSKSYTEHKIILDPNLSHSASLPQKFRIAMLLFLTIVIMLKQQS